MSVELMGHKQLPVDLLSLWKVINWDFKESRKKYREVDSRCEGNVSSRHGADLLYLLGLLESKLLIDGLLLLLLILNSKCRKNKKLHKYKSAVSSQHGDPNVSGWRAVSAACSAASAASMQRSQQFTGCSVSTKSWVHALGCN